MFNIKRWLTTALITFLIVTGVVGGVIVNWPRADDDEMRESPTDPMVNNKMLQLQEGMPSQDVELESLQWTDTESSVSMAFDTDHISMGDQCILVGNFDGAYRHYAKAAKSQGGEKSISAATLLRLALSAEQLGDNRNSNMLYQNAVRRSADGSLIRILGLTGVARTWQSEGLEVQAHEMLSELFLRYGSNDAIHEEVRFQISNQLSSLIQQQRERRIPSPSVLETLEYHWVGPSIDAMIEILTQEGAGNQLSSVESSVDTIRVLQRPSPDVNLIAVEASTSLTLISDILKQFANQSQLEMVFSARAKDAIHARSSRLDVTGLPLAVVLDQLLSPLGLIWVQEGETVYFYHEIDVDSEFQTYLTGQAIRVMRTIELTLPRDARRSAALLHRGNLSLLARDGVAAANRYSELAELQPNNELAAKLSFNRAILANANGDTDDAIRKLYFTVDQSLSQKLQAKSYGWIGRFELQSGRPDRAIYALSRGLAQAQDSHLRQDILMNLARAHLLESDPFSANRILFENADFVIDDVERKKAAVFSAYSRYLGMVAGEGLRNEGERMVIALASITPEDASGFADKLLIGRAFFEVGFKSRSNEYLQLALDAAPHEAWRRRVAFELATNRFREGDLSGASELFKTLITEPADTRSLLAQIKIAEIALRQRNPELCLENCQQIWQQGITDEQKAETLSMMGRAYQRLERHQMAAICFSGMLPNELKSNGPVANPDNTMLNSANRSYE